LSPLSAIAPLALLIGINQAFGGVRIGIDMNTSEALDGASLMLVD
jgi:hypothetical protein